MVMGYWSAVSLFCQVSIDITWMSNIKDVRCKPRLGINWGLAVMFCIVVVVVVVGGTQSILLAMLTMKKELHGFLFVWMDAVLFLKLRCSAWWPFGLPELYY